MAGKLRIGPYPSAYSATNLPPHIQGFTPEQDWAHAHPDPPSNFPSWTDYITAVVDANAAGQQAPRPLNPWGADMTGDSTLEPQAWLQHSLGFGRLAPLLDTSVPQVQQFLDQTYYANSSHDAPSFFGDQFATALLGLGLATGGAAAFGGFAGPGAAGAAPALNVGAGEAITGSVGPALSGGGGSSLFGTAATYAPYANAGGMGLNTLGRLTGNDALSTAGTALGYASMLGGGMPTGAWGSTGDWLSAAMAAAGLGNAVFTGVQGNKAQNTAQDAVDLQTQLAQQLFSEASPLRQGSQAGLAQFLATGQLPVGLQAGLDPMLAAGREGLEGQYNVARENILSRTPMRGGQLNKALADLEKSRAGSVGQLRSNMMTQYELPLRQSLFQMANNTGLGQSTQGLNALGSSANNFMQLAQGAQQQAGAGGQTAGALLALLLDQYQRGQNPLTGQPAGIGQRSAQQPYGGGFGL